MDNRKNDDSFDWESINITDFLKLTNPVLRNGFDAIALAIHFVMKKSGFRCIACGDQNETEPLITLLPSTWNQSSDSYSFTYRHPQSSMTYVIKAITLGEKLLIHGIALEDDKTRSLEVVTKEFVNMNSLKEYDNLYKDFNNLVGLFKVNILHHLMIPPSTEKLQPSSSTTNSQQQQNSQDDDPLRIPNNRRSPRSPLQEGPYFYPQPSNPPFGLGGNDLYPTGPALYPFAPSPNIPLSGPGGNLIGPHHPGFGPNVIDPYNNPQFVPPRGRGGRGGRGQYPPSHPPGARFDPFGPPTGNNYSQPDPDEPPPDSYNNMFL